MSLNRSSAGIDPAGRALQRRLLPLLQRCVRLLGPGFCWGGQQQNTHYVDSMGFIQANGGNELALLMCEFLDLLIQAGYIDNFQCVIANKDGNPFFASKVAALLAQGRMPTIVCKGESDRSRVRGVADPNKSVTHEIDFEGLHVFQSNSAKKMRAIIIDDNLAGASSILSIRKRIGQISSPFEPVCEIVTLFTIVDPETKGTFEQLEESANLYTLVRLSNDDIKQVHDTPADRLELLLNNRDSMSDGFGLDWLHGKASVLPSTPQ